MAVGGDGVGSTMGVAIARLWTPLVVVMSPVLMVVVEVVVVAV